MLARTKWHASLTNDAIVEAHTEYVVTLDNPGFCLVCGSRHEGIEPDARNYECESCGENQVFGAEELLLYIA